MPCSLRHWSSLTRTVRALWFGVLDLGLVPRLLVLQGQEALTFVRLHHGSGRLSLQTMQRKGYLPLPGLNIVEVFSVS